MIICISANPAIDRTVWIDELRIGKVNRALRARSAAGGKAAHVAMVARAMGVETIWIGFLGGGTGDECESQLKALNIPIEVVRTRSSTRVNQEIIDSVGNITEVLEPGAAVEADEAEQMLLVCQRLFERHKTNLQVVLSGSLPPGLDHEFYTRIIRNVHEHNGFVALDTSGAALVKALPSSPDLIKPNREEAEAVLGRTIRGEVGTAEAAREFIECGAKSVALSLGSEGLLWLDSAQGDPLLIRPPSTTVRSTVGCGDATVAGFMVGRSRQQSSTESAVLAVACGAANCFASAPGLVDVNDVRRLVPQIDVQPVKVKTANT